MTLFSKRANLNIAIGIIVLSPVSRVATLFAWYRVHAHMGMMLHTRLDTIMTGCLLALLIDMKLWEKAIRAAILPLSPVAAILFLLAIDTPLSMHWKGYYLTYAGFSLENIAIAALLLFVVFRHTSLLGRFLNLSAMRHLGMISYSIYLWQQLFTGPRTWMFPLNILLILGCAELSYLCVERPSFKLREMFVKMRSSNRNSYQQPQPILSEVPDEAFN